MQSSALGSSNGLSMYLHRSPSGAQRRIRQRMGGDWPLQKSTLTSSTENLESCDNLSSSLTTNNNNNPSSYRPTVDNFGYRNLIESSGYRSLLPDDLNSSRFTEPLPIEEKLSNWSLSSNKYLNSSSISLNNSSIVPSSPIKPTPMPRSQEPILLPPQTLQLNGRQRHNSGSSNSYNASSADSSMNMSSSPKINKFISSSDLNPQQFPQSPIKPMVHVHPFPVPRAVPSNKPLPPPVPEKPKSLQTARLKSIEIADKSTSSINELDINQVYSNMDNETLIKMEDQRIATLTSLYEKVSGRWEDLKNLHNEKKKNSELFEQTMDIAKRNGIPTSPFLRFVKRFESVYEVQTRLVLNKQQLRKSLESTRDDEFLTPLIKLNDSNTQDIEKLVDELDATFRQLDGQLCEVLEPEQHERWVFFVRTLYSLISEQTSIQYRVRYVTGQIKKLEDFTFKQLGLNRSANTTHNSSSASNTKLDC